MKKLMMIVIAVALIAGGLFLTSVPASAEGTATKTIVVTEAQANSYYRFTNPIRRSVTSLVADFQPGRVVITATAKYRNDKTVILTTTYVPSISNGRIYWTITSISANDKSAPADLINQINAQITSSWINYWKQKSGTGRVVSLTITDADATVVVQPMPR